MRICLVTGSRSEWGLIEPILRAARERPGLLPLLIVTGSHVSRRHGYTLEEVRAVGPEPAVVVDPGCGESELSASASEASSDVARMAARMVGGIGEALAALRPEWVVVAGDRFEAFAAAAAAALLARPLAHVGAGETDVATNLDGNLRNAITKLAAVSFVAHESARRRVLALGEEAWRVRVVGLPSLDRLEERCATREELLAAGLVPAGRPFILGSYFPVTHQPEDSRRLLEVWLDALAGLDDLHKLIVVTNADAGADAYERRIRAWAAARRDVTLAASIPAPRYLAALKHAACYVGNSSSGVIEAPAFGTPAVIVGTRQQGRPKTDGVRELPDPSSAELRDAVRGALRGARPAAGRSLFGDGRAAPRICDALIELAGRPDLCVKRLVGAETPP